MASDTNQLSLEEAEKMNRDWENSQAASGENSVEGLTVPIDEISDFIKYLPGKRMLDVGCAWGRYVQYFLDAGLEYTGIDISSRVLEEARVRFPKLAFELMSFRQLDFPDSTFDGIWCCCSLSYEPKHNVESVLKEMLRVLVPGGILLLILPDMGASFEKVAKTPDGDLFQAFWDPWEFKDRLRAMDLNVIYAQSNRIFSGSMEFVIRK